MPARVWPALAGLALALLVAVIGLDQWQARQGEASLFGLPWPAPGPGPRPTPSLRPTLPPGPPGGPGSPRIAVVIDDLGGRRDVFELVSDLRRPVAVAVLPDLPLSQDIARAASALGLEVLLDLPMEPYRYPEIDPGPGALLMAMSPEALRGVTGRHLERLPGVIGVINHHGSRMTEDRTRMRAVLEVLARRKLFLVDAQASNLSVAYDVARSVGVRAARRQVVVDPAAGEAAGRVGWARVGALAAQRGEALAIARGHPLTVRLLREEIPRWEARGLRVVPVSQLAR